MSGVVYGPIPSPNVARAFLVAKYLGLDGVTVKYVDLMTGEHKKEPFINYNPFGTVPIYVSADDKVKIYESRAIGRYLDLANGGKLLKISDPATYGKVEQWAAVEADKWSKFASLLLRELFVKPTFMQQQPDQAVVDSNKAELAKSLEVYEKHFATAKTAFLTSDEVSLADLFHIPSVAPLLDTHLKEVFAAYPLVSAWFNKLVALPAWQAVVKEQQALMAAFAAQKK
jgi:glutathione S-transferase